MTNSVLQQLQHLVSQGELRDALEELNRLAECRFTAFFQFSDDGLRNLVLVDRDDRKVALMDTVPVDQSYCHFVRESKDAFVVSDSLVDERLGDHVKRPVVKSYFGYPVKVDGATVFGTVCHFDFDVVNVREEVLRLTQAFAEGFETERAMQALHEGLDHRLQSLTLMTATILDSAESREDAYEAFSIYVAPLLHEAERVLSPETLGTFRASVADVEADFSAQFDRRV